jgi:hypothetical protein
MGLLRDKVDLAAAVQDHRRAAQAGGPRFIARSPGRNRGADRFPPKRVSRRGGKSSGKR